MPARKTLTEAAKVYTVTALAQYNSAAEVATKLQEEYGLFVTRQVVQRYDPTAKSGARLSQKWRDLFTTTRATFVKDLGSIGIAQQVVRLRTLQRCAAKAEEKDDIPLVLQCLEQAAREIGGSYTNKFAAKIATYRAAGEPDAANPATVKEAANRYAQLLRETGGPDGPRWRS